MLQILQHDITIADSEGPYAAKALGFPDLSFAAGG
jgi:hypothetical protein